MNYGVYVEKTGEIVKMGSCPPSMCSSQVGPGEEMIEGEADDQKHIVKNGEIVLRAELGPKIMKESTMEDLIRVKMRTILRRLAIEELDKEKDEGAQ